MGPMGGGMSIPMNPDRQRVFPIWETCSSIGGVRDSHHRGQSPGHLHHVILGLQRELHAADVEADVGQVGQRGAICGEGAVSSLSKARYIVVLQKVPSEGS